jgi:hypothetical protein
MFRLEKESQWAYDHQIGTINLLPKRIVEIFGPPVPNPGEPEKCTGEYVFVADSGRRYSLHDWRETNLSEGPHAPSPQEFWSLMEPRELSIGSEDPVDIPELEAFQRFLVEMTR